MAVIKEYVVDGRDEYVIQFEQQSNGVIRMDALEHPPDPHGKGVHQNHLYSSGQICVASGHEPRTFDRARAIAMSWCEGWSHYCRTGSFPNGAKRVNV